MARRRYKPSVRAICAIGTLAHNRPFTATEIAQYVGPGGLRHRQTHFDAAAFARWLKKHGHVRSVPGRKLYPTAKGWKMIEKACGRRR